MFVRARLLVASLMGGSLLLVILCLGAQNLDQRPSLNLGFSRSAPLPAGFLVGVALVSTAGQGPLVLALAVGLTILLGQQLRCLQDRLQLELA